MNYFKRLWQIISSAVMLPFIIVWLWIDDIITKMKGRKGPGNFT